MEGEASDARLVGPPSSSRALMMSIRLRRRRRRRRQLELHERVLLARRHAELEHVEATRVHVDVHAEQLGRAVGVDESMRPVGVHLVLKVVVVVVVFAACQLLLLLCVMVIFAQHDEIAAAGGEVRDDKVERARAIVEDGVVDAIRGAAGRRQLEHHVHEVLFVRHLLGIDECDRVGRGQQEAVIWLVVVVVHVTCVHEFVGVE